jgi:hypothetical protein
MGEMRFGAVMSFCNRISSLPRPYNASINDPYDSVHVVGHHDEFIE